MTCRDIQVAGRNPMIEMLEKPCTAGTQRLVLRAL